MVLVECVDHQAIIKFKLLTPNWHYLFVVFQVICSCGSFATNDTRCACVSLD